MQTPQTPPNAGPPPVAKSSKPPSWRFQFNTASLLGLMALVAVVCLLSMTLPIVLRIVLALGINCVLVAYCALLLAGVFAAQGKWRIFCASAFTAFVVLNWSDSLPSAASEVYAVLGGNPYGGQSTLLFTIFHLVWAVERIAISLFAGWVGFHTAKYWEPLPKSADD